MNGAKISLYQEVSYSAGAQQQEDVRLKEGHQRKAVIEPWQRGGPAHTQSGNTLTGGVIWQNAGNQLKQGHFLGLDRDWGRSQAMWGRGQDVNTQRRASEDEECCTCVALEIKNKKKSVNLWIRARVLLFGLLACKVCRGFRPLVPEKVAEKSADECFESPDT